MQWYFIILEIILWWSEILVSETFVFTKLGLKFVSKRSMQLEFFEFLKQVWLTFIGESANVSKNWLRIELLVIILKLPTKTNFSNLFDSLLIIVSRLQQDCDTLATRFLFLRNYYLYSQNVNGWRVFDFYDPIWRLIINTKSNSFPKSLLWKDSSSSFSFIRKMSTFPLIS